MTSKIELDIFECQEQIFYNTPERFVVVPKGRRLGATQGAALFCIDSLFDGKKILWIETIQNNIDKYYNRYFLPKLKNLDQTLYQYKVQAKELTLGKGYIDFRSAEKPQNIEGFGYDIIILNEAGIILKGQKGRNLWFNTVYPMTIDYKAKVFFLGTPKGKRAKKDEHPNKMSLYYELAFKGGYDNPDGKHPDWKCYRFTSYDNPLNNPDDIDEMAKDIPASIRKQEIEGFFVDIGESQIFHREWFEVLMARPKEAPQRRIISIDTAFKVGTENDDSAGICIEKYSNMYLITDCFCSKYEFNELVAKSKGFQANNAADIVLIEDKASGQSLIQMYKNMVDFPVVPVKPDGDKLSRAVAATPFFESKKVYLLFGWWNNMFIDQMCEFSGALDTPDDIVDCVSQGFNYFKGFNYGEVKPVVTRKVLKSSESVRGY
jgi:predicted phage terminase large subunit-like protein